MKAFGGVDIPTASLISRWSRLSTLRSDLFTSEEESPVPTELEADWNSELGWTL